MLIWNVKLFDRVLVAVTDKGTAEALTALLNNGTLHGVPGDAAAYEDARGPRTAPTTVATVEEADPLVDAVLSSNVPEARALIRDVHDLGVLDALHAAERKHPKYRDGRNKVLDAIEERKGEITTADPRLVED